jgi:hypothetical protein
MYGESTFISNHSARCSRRTDGANGRKLSRYLIEVHDRLHLRRAWIAEDAAAASARGPNSMRPWCQPTTFSSARSFAASSMSAASS